jgi:hypothetical protein
MGKTEGTNMVLSFRYGHHLISIALKPWSGDPANWFKVDL